MASGSTRRADGRQSDEIRPIKVSVGELDRADGSGKFSFGSTAALATVSGPIEVRLREELPDKATFEVVHRPLEGVGATPSRALINTLQTVFPPLLALGSHPRSLIQLVVQSLSASPASDAPLSSTLDDDIPQTSWPLESDSALATESGPSPMTGSYFGSRAVCINSASLALLNAGSIGMKGLVIAVALAYLPADEAPIVDPTNDEERDAISRHGFGWAFGAGVSPAGPTGAGIEVDEETNEMELVWAESEGDFSRSEHEHALETSRGAARRIYSRIRAELERRYGGQEVKGV